MVTESVLDSESAINKSQKECIKVHRYSQRCPPLMKC